MEERQPQVNTATGTQTPLESKVLGSGVRPFQETTRKLPNHLAILQLKGKIFTSDECAEWKDAFVHYWTQGLIKEKKGGARFRIKHGIAKGTTLYVFVKEENTKEFKMLEELWRKRVEWIRLCDSVNCDRTDRVVEDGQRAAERRKTEHIERQIEDEVEWMKGPKKATVRKEPFMCRECGGTSFKIKNGQQACTHCGVGWTVASMGPGPRAIKKTKRKVRRVEYINGAVMVLEQKVKGWADVDTKDGWTTGKGVM